MGRKGIGVELEPRFVQKGLARIDTLLGETGSIIHCEHFEAVGFYFDYKQRVLEELATNNRRMKIAPPEGCPGARRLSGRKPRHSEEKNADRLPPGLLHKHFDGYWQICKALGCPRRPKPRAQLELLPEDN